MDLCPCCPIECGLQWHRIQRSATFYSYCLFPLSGWFVWIVREVPPLPVYVTHTLVTSLEQSSEKGKAWIVFLIKNAGSWSNTGSCREQCPSRIAQSLYSAPIDPGFLNKSSIELTYSMFSTKKCRRSLAMVHIYLDKFATHRSGPFRTCYLLGRGFVPRLP
jgi:hypothetical protein